MTTSQFKDTALSMNPDLCNLSNKPTGYYETTRKDMLRYLPRDVTRTLEFGCGTGGFSALVKDKYHCEAWAVEIDHLAAEKAAQKLDKVINKDAHESLPEIPEGYFDCIFAFDILEHLVNPYTLLCALKTKLTKEGVIIASIPNVRYYRTFIDLVIHGNWDYKNHGILDKTHLRFFTYKSIVKMFEQLNFEIIKLEGIHPTSSRTFRLLNIILFNSFSDVRYKHFAVVAKPR